MFLLKQNKNWQKLFIIFKLEKIGNTEALHHKCQLDNMMWRELLQKIKLYYNYVLCYEIFKKA
jgi:hypothetical protein